MDRRGGVHGKNLHEQDLAGLAELCGNVADRSANRPQVDTAHALRVEWLRLNHSPHDGEDADASLKKRMLEFLIGVPAWMMVGV